MQMAFREKRIEVDGQPYAVWFFPTSQTAHCGAHGGIDVCGVTSADEAAERVAAAIRTRQVKTATA